MKPDEGSMKLALRGWADSAFCEAALLGPVDKPLSTRSSISHGGRAVLQKCGSHALQLRIQTQLCHFPALTMGMLLPSIWPTQDSVSWFKIIE